MRYPRPTVALAVATAAVLMACTTPPAGAPSETPTLAGTTTPPTDDPSPSPAMSSPAPSPTPDGPNGRLELTGWDQHHDNPTSIELLAVEVDDAGNILVDIEALNSYHRGQVRLALPDVATTDDVGNAYEFVRLDDQGRELYELGMEADERLAGTLAFIGPIDPDATHLDIGFNQSSRQDGPIAASQDTQGQYPKFYFADVPLPGIGLDDEANKGSGQGQAPAVEVDRTVEPDDWPGIAVTVTRIVADGRTVTIELEVINQYDRTMQFLNRNPVLRDGHDSSFYYVDNTSDDPTERWLELTPGDEATVTLSWRGSIHPDADTFSLTFNNLDRSSSPDLTASPYIPIDDLPVPRPDAPEN